MPGAARRLSYACCSSIPPLARAFPQLAAAPPPSCSPQPPRHAIGRAAPRTWSPSQSLPFTVSYMCQRQSSTVRLASAALMPPCSSGIGWGLGLGQGSGSGSNTRSEGWGRPQFQTEMRESTRLFRPLPQGSRFASRNPAGCARQRRRDAHTWLQGVPLQARITTGRASSGPPRRSQAHAWTKRLIHWSGVKSRSCVAAAHLGRHSVAARGEQLGNHCRLEAVLRQTHRRAQTSATGTHNDRIVRVVDCSASRQRG
jgi:hypothetical protein